MQPAHAATLVLETFEDNPFLASFYQDPERYAFQAQVVFLLSRFRQQRAVQAMAGRVPLVSDYLFAKDQLFARLNLHGDEWETYKQLHAVLAERIVEPDLVIYLRASVPTLMARIRHRDRPYERAMTESYIARLSECYEEFFAAYEATPLLVLDTERLNFPGQAEDVSLALERVAAAVAPVLLRGASGLDRARWQ